MGNLPMISEEDGAIISLYDSIRTNGGYATTILIQGLSLCQYLNLIETGNYNVLQSAALNNYEMDGEAVYVASMSCPVLIAEREGIEVLNWLGMEDRAFVVHSDSILTALSNEECIEALSRVREAYGENLKGSYIVKEEGPDDKFRLKLSKEGQEEAFQVKTEEAHEIALLLMMNLWDVELTDTVPKEEHHNFINAFLDTEWVSKGTTLFEEIFEEPAKMRIVKTCPDCGILWDVEVLKSEYLEWKPVRGKQAHKSIQQCMSSLKPSEREIFLSGLCNDCYNKFDEEF